MAKTLIPVRSRGAEALIPGVRDRLIEQMDLAGIPAHQRIGYLARVTARARQTANRWVSPSRPGLPDLTSFTAICRALECEPDELLGVTGKKAASVPAASSSRGTPMGRVAAMSGLDAWLRLHCAGYVPMVMPGDDMAPKIADGALLLVDTSVASFSGNGTYVLEYNGGVLVREVEVRVGAGVTLRCANQRFEPSQLLEGCEALRRLTIHGRVMRVMCVTSC